MGEDGRRPSIQYECCFLIHTTSNLGCCSSLLLLRLAQTLFRVCVRTLTPPVGMVLGCQKILGVNTPLWEGQMCCCISMLNQVCDFFQMQEKMFAVTCESYQLIKYMTCKHFFSFNDVASQVVVVYICRMSRFVSF